MKHGGIGGIRGLILRLLHWLSRLIGGKTARSPAQCPRIDAAAQPDEKGDDISSGKGSALAPSSKAEQLPEVGGASWDEAQEDAVETAGNIERSSLGKTTSAPEQVSAEQQGDTTHQMPLDPTVEKECSYLPLPQRPTPPTCGEPAAMPDEVVSVPVMPSSATSQKHFERVQSDTRPNLSLGGTERQATPVRRHKTVAPEQRGGRPRSPAPKEKTKDAESKASRSSRPEIVCWKRTREWVIGVEIPDEILQAGVSVLQADDALSEDGSRPGYWPLATLNAAVKIQVGDIDNQTIDIPVGDGGWLLFKLSGSQLEAGRKVTRISSGSYLAIVPETWRRDEEKAGTPPIMPEPVFLDGYLAHFFDLDDVASTRIAFRDDHDIPIDIGSPGIKFCLVGHEIHDASERIGPLFGEVLPAISIENGQWSDVGKIVIGQEGGGCQQWRMSFEPKADEVQQQLPREALERKAGWYFLRFYDSSDTLIDSLDFRFVAGLRALQIATADRAPFTDGHRAQTVGIVHDAGYRVTPFDRKYPGLKVEEGTDKTILTIPPTAECDRTRWLIQPPNSHGQEVEFTILIERVWWALGGDDTEPSQWKDECLKLTREDFTAASGRAIWLRFPKPRWANNEVFAGFARERARKFTMKVTDKVVSIPLRDFSATQELDDRAHEHKFKVWLEVGQGTHEVTVAALPVQELPVQEEAGRLNLAGIPAQRLATVLTKLRRAARGRTRQMLKEVRRKYRRQPRSRPDRNADFVKEGLCLIAVVMEGVPALCSSLSDYWKKNARLARREFPDRAREMAKSLKE